MSGDTIQILIAMIAYMLVVVGIGLFLPRERRPIQKIISWAAGPWGPG